MKIFLTGGTGFVGSNLINHLYKNGIDIEVTALRRPGSQPRVSLLKEPKWIQGDLSRFPKDALNGCKVLVHLAATGVLPKDANWDDCFRVNVIESINLWRAAQKSGVQRFLICGSCFEYGKVAESEDFVSAASRLEPTGSYHASKAAATMAAIGFGYELGVELAVFRPFHIFGEGEDSSRFWPSLKDHAIRGEDFPMSYGEQIRDFTPVDVVCKNFAHGIFRQDLLPGKPAIENIGTGKPQTLKNFAEFWWKEWKAKGSLQFGKVGYRPGEVMRYVPLLD
jgi:nucleoside-diphosphate-sugar epimerase